MWHLIRVNTVRLPRADLDPRAEILAWNRLLMGLFWLKLCSNGSKRGWIRFWPAGLNWHFRGETDLLIFNARLGNELVQSYQKTNEQALLPSEISDTDQTFEKKNLFQNKPTLTRRLRRESGRHEQGGQKVPRNPSNQHLIGLADFLFT